MAVIFTNRNLFLQFSHQASDSQIDIGQEVSNTMLDDKTVKPDDIKMPGGDDSQPTLLQSMLSMGAEPEEPVEGM